MKHLLLLALLLVSVFIAEAAPAAVDKEIRFARGANSTLINGSVIRGESDQYSLATRAGQKMAVNITSLEKMPHSRSINRATRSAGMQTASWNLREQPSRAPARATTPRPGRATCPPPALT